MRPKKQRIVMGILAVVMVIALVLPMLAGLGVDMLAL